MKLEQIVTEVPVYGSFKLKVFSKGEYANRKDEAEQNKEFISALFHTEKVHLKCVDCKQEYPFMVKQNMTKIDFRGDIVNSSSQIDVEWRDPMGYASRFPVSALIGIPIVDKINEYSGYINYTFNCTMNQKHVYTMKLRYTLFENGEMEFIKVGQFPINMALKDSNANTFQKELKKINSLDDYKKYEQCSSRDLLAGCCTYLRRIFEKMVYSYLVELKLQNESYDHFSDKIEAVKEKFDADIHEMLPGTYSLLSKGIHELDDSQIKNFYLTLSEIIDTQLLYEKMRREQKERKELLKKKFNKNFYDISVENN